MPPKKRALFNTGKRKATVNKPIAVPDKEPGESETSESVVLLDPLSNADETENCDELAPKRKKSFKKKVQEQLKKVKTFFSKNKQAENLSSVQSSPVAGPSGYTKKQSVSKTKWDSDEESVSGKNSGSKAKWDTDEESDSVSKTIIIQKLEQEWDSEESCENNDRFSSTDEEKNLKAKNFNEKRKRLPSSNSTGEDSSKLLKDTKKERLTHKARESSSELNGSPDLEDEELF